MLAYNLGLSFWIGGGLALGAISAPTLFGGLESRQTAGALFGRMLRKYSRVRVAAILVIIGAAAIKTASWEGSAGNGWILARWGALAVMAALLLTELLYLERAVDRLRAAGATTLETPQFARLHKTSETVMKLSLAAAVVALLLG
jgi:uncharacterized membrane protein